MPAETSSLALPLAGELAATADLGASARAYAVAGVAPATRRLYAAEWASWCAWCASRAASSLPGAPEDVADYLAHLADRGRAAAGIEVALVALNQAHKAAGFPSPRAHPLVQRVRRGIRRRLGTAPHGRTPLLLEGLRRVLAALPAGADGVRDRAVLLLGWAGALRRSELVALDLAAVTETAEGLRLLLRRSKTDQEGAGRAVGVPYGSDPATCPVRALRAWQALRGAGAGPLFWSLRTRRRLTGRDVARILQRRAAAAGLAVGALAAHSLRAGLVTQAARAGKSERAIMAHTGHKSVVTMRRYIREAELFTENPAVGIGL